MVAKERIRGFFVMGTTRFVSEINFVRALACLAVLAVHVSAGVFYAEGSWDPFAALINQIGRFGTPVFAVISGFLLFNQVKNKGFSLRRFIRSRTTKILIPYLIWSTVYLLILKYVYHVDHFASLKQGLYILFTGGAFYHLYFVSTVIQFYLVFPLLQRVLRTGRAWWIGTAVALVVNVAFLVPEVTDWPGWIGTILSHKAFLPSWIFYFLLGGLLAHHWTGLTRFFRNRTGMLFSFLTGVLVTAGAVVEYHWAGMYGSRRLANLINIPLLILTASVLYTSVFHRLRIREWFQALGNLGFGIYLVHPLVILVLVQLLPSTWWNPSSLPLLFLFVLLLSVGLVQVIRLLPFHQYLLTVPSRRARPN